MNISRESQGYFGDVNLMSTLELKELLARKEKLLAKRSLLDKLPDKGEKVSHFIEKIRLLINERHQQKESQGVKLYSQPTYSGMGLGDQTIELIKGTSNGSSTDNKPYVDRNTENDSYVEDEFQRMTIGSTLHSLQSDNITKNAYEQVLKKDIEQVTSTAPKFLPNKTLKSRVPSGCANSRTKQNQSEESAVNPPQYKHQMSKLISLNESIQLTTEQQKRSEELAIERATKRLLGQASSKMNTYSPAVVDMKYRQHANDGDDDEPELDSDDDYGEERT